MDKDTEKLQNTMTGEEVVVTGMSGIFPNSDSVQKFMENLYNKVDMVSNEPRWILNDPELPKYTGIIEGMKKFDAQFFKVGYQQANVMDPLSGKLLEHAYGAIFDSGNTRTTLKGKIVGVFIGSSKTDFSANCMYDISKYTEFMVGGSSKSMFANRISYWVDGKGPSYCLDYSCVSSIAALEQAYRSIKSGDCDAAVVGGCNHCVMPAVSLNSKRAGLLCLDGKTKCFDKKGDGYVRSDAINVIFLQKAKDAKRVYAEVYHAHGGYQLKPNESFLPLRQSDDLQNFLNEVYSGTNVDPKNVEYIEANGAALAEADENEVNAIANFFANDKAVKVGCVKSNMGHSESASGLCGLTKLCLAYQKGQIPANLHCEEPVESATDGRVQVVTENTEFERGYTALNSLSYTGVNFHVLLKGHYKAKTLEKYNSRIPRIVLASGRKESCVSRIIDDLKSKQMDAEEIALLHSIFENDIVGHTGRGYAILDTIKGNTVAVSESIDYYSGVKPPLWFVYSGMGSQWPGMAADLMRFPIFASAIERCDKVLAPKGIDIVKVITDPDINIFQNMIHAFVGIGAVQIGLTEILKEMGIVPDYIIGHSLGETACAYQDNTLTMEEMMLCSYSRGKAIQESVLVKGSMAAVGIGFKTLASQCPPEIDIACHNSSESSTISGPAEVMKEFVDELTKRGIFARIITSGNVAYHSRYISDAAPVLLRRLKQILKNPRPRSQRWISTSVPREKWEGQDAKYSSAEYHVNNLINPVLFEEMAQFIPKNAVVVEIAPHSLLHAILKVSHKECTLIPLTRRGNRDGAGVTYLLNAIGKLYQAGYNPKVDILYPKVEFPVSTETPLLSHLVEWEHSEDWPGLQFKEMNTCTSISRKIVFSLYDNNYKYLEGYIRNGVNVLPEAGLLAFVWETLAMYNGMEIRNMPVEFKDVQFHSEIDITVGTPVRFTVVISKGNDYFEVTREDNIVVTGIVSVVKVMEFRHIIENNDVDNPDDEFQADVKLTSEDIYKILRTRGFSYRGKFQSIHSSNLYCDKALITWTDNWVLFLDSLIQLNTVSRDFNGVSKPKFIRRLKISAFEQEKVKYETVDGVNCYDAKIFNIYGVTRCAGVEIKDIRYTDVPLQENTANALETRSFFSYFPIEEVNIKTAIKMNLQIISENSITENIAITKVVTGTVPKEFDFIDMVAEKVFWVNTEIITLRDSSDEVILSATKNNEINHTNVIVLENLLQYPKDVKRLQNLLSKDTFILSLEDKVPKLQFPLKDSFNILSSISDGTKNWILMRRVNQKPISHITINFDDTFSWVPDVLSKLVTTKRIVLVSERQPYCGVLGLVKKLKADGHNNISVVIVEDSHAPKFDPDNDLYKEQLQKNMTVNILRKGQWGSFFFKPSKMSIKQKSFALKNLVAGSFDQLSWVEAPKIFGDRTLVQVCYSGLSRRNFHEVLDDDKNEASSFGMEFSGIDRNGDKVMGLIARGSVASTIEVDSNLLWPVPDHWTLEDAATVPLAYVQAYYCLTIRCTLREGKSVLILDATCSVGLALIALCISFHCTIYCVVGSEDKKKKLLQLFPQLDENNIICSNNESFYNDVMTKRKGQGCDFIINFASGHIREAAMKLGSGCHAYFLDFSKHDIYENKNIGMYALFQSSSYMTVDVTNIFRPEYSADRKNLQNQITQGIKNGVVQPLTRVVYSPLQVERAFKALSLYNNTEKVLMRVRDPSIMTSGLKVIPRLAYSLQDVLIIVCDEKGIGIELADKLINRGARKIILHMKTSSISGYLHKKFLTWGKQEVSIKLSSDNLQTEHGSWSLMKNAMKFGKVKGIFVVFDPKQTDNGMKEDFVNAFKKQSVVLLNLDMASRNCIDLSHFIILSRFTQSASDEYALSLTERVCDKRNEMGFPTLLLRYDSLVELDEYISKTKKTQPQTFSALFNAIETSLKLEHKNVLTFDLRNEEKVIEKKTPEHEDGMYTFYKHVFTEETEEENLTSQVVVELPTLLNNGIKTSWDPDDSFIILVPGFEGRPQIFESAAEMLKMRAVSIELGPDAVGESIQDIALYTRKELNRRFGNIINKKFYIMGYSFGVNVAMELAAILEKEGNTGTVYCIDGSPDEMRTILETVLGEIPNDDDLQNHVLNHIHNLITEMKGSDLKADLKKIATFEEKVEECLKRMKGIVKYSKQFMKLMLESAYKRIVMAREYMPDIKLKSTMVLMKSSIHLTEDKFTHDYGLSKYSEEPVKVFSLGADHATAPHDIQVSNIVNLFLETNHLNNFNKLNLCDSYLINRSSISHQL